MWSLVMYSNYFETVSTVMNQTHFQVTMFAFNTVLLYDDYYIICTWYNMCSAWFLDVRISTFFGNCYNILLSATTYSKYVCCFFLPQVNVFSLY